MRSVSRFAFFSAVLLLCAGYARQATAAAMFTLDVSDPTGGAQTITNNTPPTLSSINITYKDSNVSAAIALGHLGSGSMDLDISNVNVSTTSAFTISFTLTANDLFVPSTTLNPANYQFLLTGSIPSSWTSANNQSQFFVDTGNNVPTSGGLVSTLSLPVIINLPPPTPFYSNSASGQVASLNGDPLSGPFSMSIKTTLSFPANSSGSLVVSSYDAKVTLTGPNGGGFFQSPEPASFAMWGIGLGLVGLRRFRRRKLA